MAEESDKLEPQAKPAARKQAAPHPLPYETPPDQAKHDADVARDVNRYAIGSAIIAFFYSAVIPTWQMHNTRMIGGIYLLGFAVMALAIFGMVFWFDRRRTLWHRTLGVLIGVGAACLIMGVCFVAHG